jgi:hypothetical protein
MVTFSVGVLSAAERVGMFDPTLASVQFTVNSYSTSKIDSLRNMFYLDHTSGYEDVMGLYNVLYIQLDQELWDRAVNKDYEIIFAIPKEAVDVGRCTVIHNYDLFTGEFYQGSRIFACALMAKEAKELELASDWDSAVGALIDNLFEALGLDSEVSGVECAGVEQDEDLNKYNPDAILKYPFLTGSEVPCLFQYRSTQHTIQVGPSTRQDAWKGTWASFRPYVPPSASSPNDLQAHNDEYEDVIKAPLYYSNSDETAIHFAGEAYCGRWGGFTHGALDSGRLEARKIIYALNTIDPGSQAAKDWEAISNKHMVPPNCDAPLDYGPPYQKSKTIPR